MVAVSTFNITDVARTLGLRYIGAGKNGEQIYRCPFCGDSRKHPYKGHLYLNPRSGKYWCARCWTGGYAVGLYARVMGVDNKTAYKELLKHKNVSSAVLDIPEAEEEVIEDVPYRDRVYREFLSLLTLHGRHKSDLLRRGLSEEAISKNGYKSLPDDPRSRWTVCRALSKKYDLSGVPGFYQKKSKKGKTYWDCTPGPGYLIPVRDVEGQIQGFQIRCDNPGQLTVYAPGKIKIAARYIDTETGEATTCTTEVVVPCEGLDALFTVPPLKVGDTVQIKLNKNAADVVWYVSGPAVIGRGDKKYIWFSSPEAGANAVPHVTSVSKEVSKKVWITEGPLKADIASFLLKETFVGIPGVGAWRPVKGVVAQLKPNIITVAFDADWRTNKNVFQAVNQLVADLKKDGYQVTIASWDPALGKGIDDVAVTLHHRQTIEATTPAGASVKRTTEVTVKVSSEAVQNESLFKKILRLFGGTA